MDTRQLSLIGLGEEQRSTTDLGGAPSGLTFHADAVSADLEKELLAAIDLHPWLTSMSRRVQHYGWKYDYKSRKVSPDSYLGPLPLFLDPLLDIVRQRDLHPDQAIVNEYSPGQGIAPHVDCEPCFGPVVAMVGLGSDTQMDFLRRADHERWSLRFTRRGLLILTGPARFDWSHAIAKRRNDQLMAIRRSRRVSVTFRSVITSDYDGESSTIEP